MDIWGIRVTEVEDGHKLIGAQDGAKGVVRIEDDQATHNFPLAIDWRARGKLSKS